MKHIIISLFLVTLPGLSQVVQDSTNFDGTQDFSDAKNTRPFRTVTGTLPATCTADIEWISKSDGSAGSRLYRCNATGDGWISIDSGSGVTDHSQLSNLDFDNSGHTGFAAALHSSHHQNGGDDEVGVATSTANGIVKANSSGKIDNGWLIDMAGATSVSDGAAGLIPQPMAGDEGKCLKGNATWGTCGTGGSVDELTTTGDLLTFDGAALARLAAGSNGTVLSSDSTQPLGLRWSTLRWTQDWPFEAVSNNTATCTPGTGIHYVTANGPTCSVFTTTQPFANGGLVFPEGSKRCVNIGMHVPDPWAGSAATLTWVWAKVTGNSSNVAWTVATAYPADNANLDAITFNSAQQATIQAVGTMNKKTSEVALDMTNAAARRGMYIQFCRDASSGNSATDVADGDQVVTQWRVRWPNELSLQ